MHPETDIKALKGIGPAKAEAFARMGVFNVYDLLLHLPRGYEDRGNIRTLAEGVDGSSSSFLLTVGSVPKTARIRRGMSITKFRVFDESGTAEAVFFNQEFIKNVFEVGALFRFTGKLIANRGVYQLTAPKYEAVKEGAPLPDLYPVYPLTEGITTGVLRKSLQTAVTEALPYVTDYLPEDIRRKYKFPTLQTAIKRLHFPTDMGEIRSSLRRLAFDDFFLFALGMAMSKSRGESAAAPIIHSSSREQLLRLLPYRLTDAQARVCGEIAEDMKKGVPMNRILVGDVGCGKTVCAAVAAYAVMAEGHQAAIMAPTEILARQHYAELAPLFEKLGLRTALLLGATPQKQKKEIYEGLAAKGEGKIDLLIGTHALLSDKIVFSDLALAITDEQHRFGVRQRAVLRERYPSVHLLVMSATPIPRTLALVLYGDLEISRIDEMPKGRKKVATYVVDESYRTRLYAFIRKQVAEGGQVYVVCPAIEEKEKNEEEENISFDLLGRKETPPLKTAKEISETMRHALPELSIGFLHGRMKSAEKDEVMRRFAAGEIHVLVSTTVIEVGINVPRASLMIVENAERFGLSQLHQLRGRVGRGTKESYCVLLSDAKGEEARARLETMRTTHDGYLVAEQDLKQRGPGDFLVSTGSDNIRQSGGLSFRFASLCEVTDLLSAAPEGAKAILALSPTESKLFWERETRLREETKKVFRTESPLLS